MQDQTYKIRNAFVKEMPKLSLTHKTLEEIIRENVDKKTIIVADAYNYPKIQAVKSINVKRLIFVENTIKEEIKRIKENNEYCNVIAVGGCTALDFGRACSKADGQTYLIPSILSTSCISVNRSVLYNYNGDHEIIITPMPNRVIMAFPVLIDSTPSAVRKWSHSGFGDLFANMSATIDHLHKTNKNILMHMSGKIFDLIHSYVPECLTALEWVIKDFRTFDQKTLRRLSLFLYNAGTSVIKRGDTTLSAAGEHELYYEMMKQQKYNRSKSTHGEIVSIGTLLTAKILEREFAEGALFKKLKIAYKKLDIPTRYDELMQINIERKHILDGLFAIRDKNTFLSMFCSEELVDDCYSH